jgi:hypothetical protein
MAIPPRFVEAAVFRAGLCHVCTEKEVGYIDTTGRFVWRGPYVNVGVELDILI